MNYREAEMEQQVQTATGSDLQEMLERGHSLLYSGNPKAKGLVNFVLKRYGQTHLPSADLCLFSFKFFCLCLYVCVCACVTVL